MLPILSTLIRCVSNFSVSLWVFVCVVRRVRERVPTHVSADQKRAGFTQLLDAESARRNRQGKLRLTWLSFFIYGKPNMTC